MGPMPQTGRLPDRSGASAVSAQLPSRGGFVSGCAQERGHSGSMPPGFDPPHPGGMPENSPTFQRWVREFSGAQVPKGRLKPGAIRQPSLRDLSDCGGRFPTLKRWAIVACPSGTRTWLGVTGLFWEQILVVLDCSSRRKEAQILSGIGCSAFNQSLLTSAATAFGRQAATGTHRSVGKRFYGTEYPE